MSHTYMCVYLRGACAPNPATEPNIKDHERIDKSAWRARRAQSGHLTYNYFTCSPILIEFISCLCCQVSSTHSFPWLKGLLMDARSKKCRNCVSCKKARQYHKLMLWCVCMWAYIFECLCACVFASVVVGGGLGALVHAHYCLFCWYSCRVLDYPG